MARGAPSESSIDKAPKSPSAKIAATLVRRFIDLSGVKEYRTFCSLFLQRGEQVLASRRPLKLELQIKHFLEAIFILIFYFGS
jgi:hypothetical protein